MDNIPSDKRARPRRPSAENRGMMDPFHQRQSHEHSLPRTSSRSDLQDWLDYRDQTVTHDGRQRDFSGHYQYYPQHQQHPHYHTYYYNPPYVQYQGRNHLQLSDQHSTSFEEIPSPPPQYYQYSHSYSPFSGGRNDHEAIYTSHPVRSSTGGDIQYRRGSTMVARHETRTMNKPSAVSKSLPSSTLVTPVRPCKSEERTDQGELIVPVLEEGKLQSRPKSPRKTHVERPRTHSSNVIWELGKYDVLCGRGAPTSFSTGNEFLRKLVAEYQTLYLCSKRSDKPAIAWKLFDIVTSKGGRFVRRNKAQKGASSFAWQELNSKQSYEKICQALREGAPELRRRMLRDMRGTGNRGMELLRGEDNEENGKEQDHEFSKRDSRKEQKEQKQTPSEESIDHEEERAHVYPI